MPVADTRPFGWRRPHPRHLASAPCLASLARGDRSDRGRALLKFRSPPDLSAAQTPGSIEYGAKANVTKEPDGIAHAGIHKSSTSIDVEVLSDPLRRNLIRGRQRNTSPTWGKRERNRTAYLPAAPSAGGWILARPGPRRVRRMHEFRLRLHRRSDVLFAPAGWNPSRQGEAVSIPAASSLPGAGASPTPSGCLAKRW